MRRPWDRLPDSLSATVYGMRHGWLWTLTVWAVTFTAMPLMLSRSTGGQGILAFLSCSCLGFVGAMPLVKGEHNTAHNILGISAAILSQAWCVTALGFAHVTVCWTAYLILGSLPLCLKAPFWAGKWCLVAELLCVALVVEALT